MNTRISRDRHGFGTSTALHTEHALELLTGSRADEQISAQST